MKKQLSLLFFIILLSSCSNNINSIISSNQSSITSNSSSTNSSSNSFSVPSPTSSKKEVVDFLNLIGEKNNYQLNLSFDNGKTFDKNIYTENYIYSSYSNAGYIKLNSFEGNNLTLLYNFSYKENMVIENACAYNDKNGNRVPIRDTLTLNALAYATSLQKVTENDIELNWNYYFSKDTRLIEAFSYISNLYSIKNSIAAIKFSLDNNVYTYSFISNFSNESDTLALDNFLGKIENVSKASISKIDDFLKTYSLPKQELSLDLLNTISGNQAYTTKTNFYYDANKTDDHFILEEEKQIVLSSTKKQTITKKKGSEYTTFSQITKDENGKAIDNYIGYDNKVHNDVLDDDFDNIVFSPSNFIQNNAFRKTSNNTYSYYGYDGRNVIEKLTSFDVGEVFSINITIEKNKITSLQAISTTRYDSYKQKMFYETKIDFQQTFTFKEVKAYDDINDIYFSYGALGNLNPAYSDLNYSFTTLVETDTGSASNNYKKTIYVFNDKEEANSKPNTILFDQESVDTSEGSSGDPIHIINGYIKVDETHIRPFKSLEDGTLVSSGPDKEGKLKDILSFDISPNVFKNITETETNKIYQLQQEVKGIENHILGGDNKNLIVPSSLSLQTQKAKINTGSSEVDSWVLSKLSYDFVSDLYYGKEILTFSNWTNTLKPKGIDTSTITAWVEPTTWKNGASEVYKKLAELFGEKVASSLPFLYSKELEGNWGCDIYDDGTYLWAALFNDTYAASNEDLSGQYMKDFESLLRKKGFTDTNNWPLGGEGAKLVKDDLYVRIASTAMGGIRFLKFK